MILPETLVLSSAGQPAGACVVCGQPVEAGEGITALFLGRLLRFRCPGCLARFAVDPDHYQVEGPASCCDGDAGHGESTQASAAASSEWAV